MCRRMSLCHLMTSTCCTWRQSLSVGRWDRVRLLVTSSPSQISQVHPHPLYQHHHPHRPHRYTPTLYINIITLTDLTGTPPPSISISSPSQTSQVHPHPLYQHHHPHRPHRYTPTLYINIITLTDLTGTPPPSISTSSPSQTSQVHPHPCIAISDSNVALTRTLNLYSPVLGVVIPDFRCGRQFILVQIDSLDEFEEIFEFNNIGAIPVFINCQSGKTGRRGRVVSA